MFEKFTDRARKVMALANQEAQRFNHEYIGTEHILLGLVKEGCGVGALVLKDAGIDLRSVRLEVEKLIRTGSDRALLGKLPQTPLAKKVIEYAIEESRNLGHNYVGTEHVLLGLLREKDGVAAQVFANLNLNPEEARQEVLKKLEGGVSESGGINGLTDRARKVIALANQSAQLFNHEYLGTEHILLGLVREGSGVGAVVLKNLDIDLQKVREGVEKVVRKGPDMVTVGKVSLTPQAKTVIEHAVEESRTLGHNYAGTEHLLLGLLREKVGVAARVLVNLGMTEERARAEILKLSPGESRFKEGPADGVERTRILDRHALALDVELAAVQEAMQLRQSSLRLGHFLLALLRDVDDLPARALVNLGLKVEDVVAEVKRLLAESQ